MDSVVPGRTVLRTTTSCRGRRRRPPPTASDAFSLWVVSSEPSSREGVPTQRKMTSESRTTPAVSVEALRWRLLMRTGISRSIPLSKIGDLPRVSDSTFDGSESTEVTRFLSLPVRWPCPVPRTPLR